MDIQQYITSGILELYVLDRLEPAARREVEANARLHPEVRNEIDAIEQTLEAFALAAAPRVDPGLLDRIMATPLPLVAVAADTPPKEKTPKTPVEKAVRSPVGTYLAWALAALALLAAIYWYLRQNNLSFQLEENELTSAQLQSDLAALEADCAESRAALDLNEALVVYLSDPHTRDINLASTDDVSERYAMVFYNPEENRTLFRGNKLPTPPNGKQYQLWAIDGDGPKSLGVLDLDLNGEALLEMDHLPGVAAFAITLEDLGGKPGPDLTQLQVIGEV